MFFLFRREKEPDVPPVMRVSGRHFHRSKNQGFFSSLWEKLPFVSRSQSPVIQPVGESAEEILQEIWHVLGNFFYALRPWSLLFVVIGLAVFSYFKLEDLEHKAIDKALKRITHRLPDSTMSSFVSTYMDNTGQIARQVSALEMKHYPDGQTTFERPYIVLYQKGLPFWYIWSEQGKVSDDNKTYFLLGKTYFKRYNTEGELELDVLTADVTYLPHEGVAKTDAATKIKTLLGTTDTVGMQVWMADRRVKLNHQVRGYYEFKRKE